MNSIAVPHRRRHGLSLAAAIVMAGLALLVAACSGSNAPGVASVGSSSVGGSSSSGSPASKSPLAFSQCMRSHGVPNFPDPDSSGAIPKTDPQHLGVSGPQLQAAQQACQQLLPTGGSTEEQLQQCLVTLACPRAEMQQAQSEMRQLAACMRSHGLQNWPDPTIDSQGRPVFVINISKDGFDPHSPQATTRLNHCQRLTGSPAGFEISQ